MAAQMPIGGASRMSGVKATTIRYYEQIGLLPCPARSEGNRRQYDENDLKRLAFIRHARELGFELEQIRTLLALQDDRTQSCEAADRIASARMKEVEHRIAGLLALKAELQRMIDGCAHGTVGECRVIEVLANHGSCQRHQRTRES